MGGVDRHGRRYALPMGVILVLAIWVLVLPVPTALGGTVGFQDRGGCSTGRDCYADVMHYKAEPGERNRVTATADSTSTTVTIEDPGISLLPDTDPEFLRDTLTHCIFTLDRVVCTSRNPLGIERVYFDVGDGNDTATMVGTATYGIVSGRDGDDVLRGSLGSDFLSGGPGADDIHGGGGSDDAYSNDHPLGISVTLDDVANDGFPGEGDNVHGDVEHISGGSGDDVLVGNEADNRLDGNDGNDRLIGSGGDDFLSGWRGNDVLDGGSGDDRFLAERGDDTIISRDSAAEDLRWSCGDGNDTVFADFLDVVSTACEIVNRG